MYIYGLDFTSAPRKQKPITCAHTILEDNVLHYKSLEHLTSFDAFDRFLQRPGPWIAGMDFPFGQPRQLIENLGWPQTWEGYVAHLNQLTMRDFEELLREYRNSREPGDKHHYRTGDKLAGALSPMLLYRIPIGRMFFRGAPRLMQSCVSVMPCRPTTDDRVVVEAYPALVARRWLGKASYKNDVKSKQTTEQYENRRQLVKALQSNALEEIYGLRVALTPGQAADLIEDPGGDDLDALLCAVQAGWAYTQAENRYGIPELCDPLEGWIGDPSTLGGSS